MATQIWYALIKDLTECCINHTDHHMWSVGTFKDLLASAALALIASVAATFPLLIVDVLCISAVFKILPTLELMFLALELMGLVLLTLNVLNLINVNIILLLF